MSGDAKGRISGQTLEWLRGPYQTVASMPDFRALSEFERWLRLCERVAQLPNAIDPQELAALDLLDVPIKSQLLDWLERRRVAAVTPRS